MFHIHFLIKYSSFKNRLEFINYIKSTKYSNYRSCFYIYKGNRIYSKINCLWYKLEWGHENGNYV